MPFLVKDGEGVVSLKKTHIYYYQIQGQLHITRRAYCDLVVFTTKDLFIQRIEYKKSFWDDIMFPKLHKFYISTYVPVKRSIDNKLLIIIPD